MYCFEREKFYVHYQPVDTGERKAGKESDKAHLDILWAGRLDRQKRPDILCEIARYSEDLPFRFHVYGSSVMDTDIYIKKLSQLNNIKYYGAFEGLFSLPVDLYDVFLYTSQWDGLPNVLLEAISQGLPVIASSAGGISELIINEKSGFLVEPWNNVFGYIDCLKRIYGDKSLRKFFTENAYDLIIKRHSRESFKVLLKETEGYISR